MSFNNETTDEESVKTIVEVPLEEKDSELGLDNFQDALYPEGGLTAWLVVMGSFCMLFCGLGVMSTMGTILTTLETDFLSGQSDEKIGWLSGVFVMISFMLGAIVGPIFDLYGGRVLVAAGSVVFVASIFIAAQAHEYWSFMVSFCVMGGIGTSVLFTAGPAYVSHWFDKRRGLAAGVSISGGSIGGVILPIIYKQVYNKAGYTWAMRTLGFLFFGLLLIASVLIKSRHAELAAAKTSDHQQTFLQRLFDWGAFKDSRYLFTCIGIVLIELSLFVPITFLPKYGISKGLGGYGTNSLGWWSLVIVNAGSSAGRLTQGLAGDILGRFNTMWLSILFTAITILVIWLPFGDTVPGYIVFCLLWGFGSGSFVSLSPVCIGQLCSTENFGARYGTCYFVASFGTLLGPPIAGALANGKAGWNGLIIFNGSVVVAALLFFTLARYKSVGSSLKTKF